MAQEVKPTYVAYISTWLVAVQTKHFFTIINLNGVLVLQFDAPILCSVYGCINGMKGL